MLLDKVSSSSCKTKIRSENNFIRQEIPGEHFRIDSYKNVLTLIKTVL